MNPKDGFVGSVFGPVANQSNVFSGIHYHCPRVTVDGVAAADVEVVKVDRADSDRQWPEWEHGKHWATIASTYVERSTPFHRFNVVLRDADSTAKF